VYAVGGIGSGSWYRWDVKNTTESQKQIDIRHLRKNGLLRPGYSGSLSWTRNGEKSGSIRFRVLNSFLTLEYSIRMHGGDWEDVSQSVPLDWTPCNYGGKRPWFVCPIRECRRRVAVLYGSGKYFGCRHCNDLVYSSQREERHQWAERKCNEIIKRLGGNPDEEFWPDKPKHMHWKTYDRLLEKAEYYHNVSEAGLASMLMRLCSW
jgi:hypothetical protein